MRTTPARLDDLRNELADLCELHPPRQWSPELLAAITAVLAIYVAELGLGNPPAPVLELVKR